MFINTELYARVSVAVLFSKLADNAYSDDCTSRNEDKHAIITSGKLFLLELLSSVVCFFCFLVNPSFCCFNVWGEALVFCQKFYLCSKIVLLSVIFTSWSFIVHDFKDFDIVIISNLDEEFVPLIFLFYFYALTKLLLYDHLDWSTHRGWNQQ